MPLLGYDAPCAETIRKYMAKPRKPRAPCTTWLPFLQNRLHCSWAMNFFTVTTLGFQGIHVLLVFRHARRPVRQFAITPNPSMEWVIRQLREAMPFGQQPRDLFRDNDGIYGRGVRAFLISCGILELHTAYQSPWQNPYIERFVGTLRGKLLNHVILLSQAHLERLLRECIDDYYHPARLHQGLAGETLLPQPPPSEGELISIPVLGGLHHRYSRAAAWQSQGQFFLPQACSARTNHHSCLAHQIERSLRERVLPPLVRALRACCNGPSAIAQSAWITLFGGASSRTLVRRPSPSSTAQCRWHTRHQRIARESLQGRPRTRWVSRTPRPQNPRSAGGAARGTRSEMRHPLVAVVIGENAPMQSWFRQPHRPGQLEASDRREAAPLDVAENALGATLRPAPLVGGVDQCRDSRILDTPQVSFIARSLPVRGRVSNGGTKDQSEGSVR